MVDKGCDNCYYEYFDEKAYPCSLCIRGSERTDKWQPSKKTKADTLQPDCIDQAKADIAERSSWSKTYEAMCKPQTDLLVKTPHKSRESHEKNCETCRDKDAYDEWQGSCDECENGSMYSPQTERTCDNCGTPRDKCLYCIEEDRMWTPQEDSGYTTMQMERNE